MLPSRLHHHYLRRLSEGPWSSSTFPLQSVKAWRLQSSGGIPAFLLLFSCTSHLCFFFSPLANRAQKRQKQGPKQNSGPLSRHSPHQNKSHITVVKAHKGTIKASLIMSNSPSHTGYYKIQGEGDEVQFVKQKTFRWYTTTKKVTGQVFFLQNCCTFVCWVSMIFQNIFCWLKLWLTLICFTEPSILQHDHML